MRISLPPRRRKVALLAGGTAALAGTLKLLHPGDASSLHASVYGLLSGFVVGLSILLIKGKGGTPEDRSASQ